MTLLTETSELLWENISELSDITKAQPNFCQLLTVNTLPHLKQSTVNEFTLEQIYVVFMAKQLHNYFMCVNTVSAISERKPLSFELH